MQFSIVADIWDSAMRSKVMARIRGKNTKPELLVRRFLFANGFRFRLHVKSLPGTPDIVLPAYKIVVFVNGCFWHGHQGCRDGRLPTSRTAFWEEKIRRNRERDEQQIRAVEKLGWKSIIVWECSLRGPGKQAFLVGLLKEITNRAGLDLQN